MVNPLFVHLPELFFIAMVNVSMIDAVIFLCCHLSEMNGLNLVAIGNVGMVSSLHNIVMIICFSRCPLMLSCSFKMVSGFVWIQLAQRPCSHSPWRLALTL